MKKIIYLFIVGIFGLGSGAAIAMYQSSIPTDEIEKEPSYYSFKTPFNIPILNKGEVAAEVQLSLSIAVANMESDSFETISPILRDRFLEILFDHANSAGFDGRFTEISTLTPLKRRLESALKEIHSSESSEVLITSISRRDF